MKPFPHFFEELNHICQQQGTKPAYIFYDLETSGLSPAHDQILQFSAIITDENFIKLKTIDIRIKLKNDVIPNPQALIVTQTTPEILLHGTPENPAINEHDAIRFIFEIMNIPNTINIGFNNYSFDNELLRFKFFQNQLIAYKHEWDNNCRKMDIYPIVLLAHKLFPSTLTWPHINGQPTFKLEHLVKANNMSSGVSHDALVDVEDTIKLTKLLAQNNALWTLATTLLNKRTDKELIQTPTTTEMINNKSHQTGFMIDRFPSTPIMTVICLGDHPTHKNKTIWLRLDKVPLDKSSPSQLYSEGLIIFKKFGEPPFYLPLNNRNCSNNISAASFNQTNQNIDFIKRNPNILSLILDELAKQSFESTTEIDDNAALYKIGFPSNDIESLNEKFRLATTDRKIQSALKFTNEHYKEMAIRVIGNNYPELLTPNDSDSETQRQNKLYVKNRYSNYLISVLSGQCLPDHKKSSKLTFPQAISEAKTLLNNEKDMNKKKFISKLIDWYEHRRKELSAYFNTKNTLRTENSTLPISQNNAGFLLSSGTRRDRDGNKAENTESHALR